MQNFLKLLNLIKSIVNRDTFLYTSDFLLYNFLVYVLCWICLNYLTVLNNILSCILKTNLYFLLGYIKMLSSDFKCSVGRSCNTKFITFRSTSAVYPLVISYSCEGTAWNFGQVKSAWVKIFKIPNSNMSIT